MATCSSTLAWEIPRTEEPVGLQSIGSQRDTTEHDTSTQNYIYFFFLKKYPKKDFKYV